MDNVVQSYNLFSKSPSNHSNNNINQSHFGNGYSYNNFSFSRPENIISGNKFNPFKPYRKKIGEREEYNKNSGTYSEKGNKSIYSPIKIWIEDPSVLFQTFDIIPNQDMTEAERLNAMTRVVIIITAIMFIIKFPLWWIFLIIGIITIIVLWYIVRDYDSYHHQTEFLRRPIINKKPIISKHTEQPPLLNLTSKY